MTFGSLTTGLQTVTATGAVTPTAGLNTSAITTPFTIFLEIQALSSVSGTPGARIQIEESTNGFTNTVATPLIADVQGLIALPYEKFYSIKQYQMPNTYIGSSNAVMRVNVTELTGTTPSLTLKAWINS